MNKISYRLHPLLHSDVVRVSRKDLTLKKPGRSEAKLWLVEAQQITEMLDAVRTSLKQNYMTVKYKTFHWNRDDVMST